MNREGEGGPPLQYFRHPPPPPPNVGYYTKEGRVVKMDFSILVSAYLSFKHVHKFQLFSTF